MSKVAMPQGEHLNYIARVYLERLEEAQRFMTINLAREKGVPRQAVWNQIKALAELQTLVRDSWHEEAAGYAIVHGIKSSLLQGGDDYPSLTGAHFDYITSVFPNRTVEMCDLIEKRLKTAWKAQKPRVRSCRKT